MIKTIIKRALLVLMALLATVNVNVQAVYGSSLSNSARRFALSPALRQVAMPTTRALSGALRLDAGSTFARSATTTPAVHTSRLSPILFNASSKPAIMPSTQMSLPITQKVVSNQSKSKNWKKITGILTVLGVSGVTLSLMKDEIEEILDVVQATINIEIFNSELIPDEITKAIVKIYSLSEEEYLFRNYIKHYPTKYSHGTAFIVQGENTDSYYVVTAAHCVDDSKMNCIQINKDNDEFLLVEPLIVDHENDVAILLIEPERTKEFLSLNAIPQKYISNRIPERRKVLSILGYPKFLTSETLKPYEVKVAVKEPKIKLNIPGGIQTTGMESISHRIQKSLNGISGGPVIGMSKEKPYIIGVHSASAYHVTEVPLFSIRRNSAYTAGGGRLPEYLQNAEKEIIHRQQI